MNLYKCEPDERENNMKLVLSSSMEIKHRNVINKNSFSHSSSKSLS